MDNTIDTQGVEVKDTQTDDVSTSGNNGDSTASKEQVKETDKEQTIGELTGGEQKAEKKDDSVPLSKFLEMKKENKEMAQRLKDLEKNIQEGATKKEVSKDIHSLAEKHGVDADFLEEFANAVRSKAEADIEEKFEEKLRPITEKEKAQQFEQIFNEHYERAISQRPELEKVANKDVIKSLAMSPANAKKTISQLIEESYGHLVQGKPSMDSSNAHQSRGQIDSIDFQRANTDGEYFRQIMSNPELKKKYNQKLVSDISKRL